MVFIEKTMKQQSVIQPRSVWAVEKHIAAATKRIWCKYSRNNERTEEKSL